MTTILSTPAVIAVRPPSALALLAASMGRGTWTQMTPTPAGLGNFTGGPTSGIRTGYSDKMAYDAVSGRIYWIGCDHAQAQVFVCYDEATNAWTVLPTTPFASATKHGYNHTTWDPTRRRLYHRPYGERGVRSWDGSTWTTHSYSNVLSYASAANGCEWFPDLGPNGRLMIFQNENGNNGELVGFDPMTGNWTTYAEGSALSGTGDPHNVALYSPVHKVVWFGGGNGSNRMWKINAAGSVTASANIPPALGSIGPGNGMCLAVCNPANGNFIVMRNSTTWYDFDPAANTWSPRPGTAQVLAAPVQDASQPAWGTVAVPLHQYGVIVFIKGYSASNPAQMWIYKP